MLLDCHSKEIANSALTFEVFAHTSTISESIWNALDYETNIFFSKSYLQAAESALSKVFKFRFIVFYNSRKKPVGLAVTQIFKLKTKDLSEQEIPCSLTASVKTAFLKRANIQLLVCGNVFVCGPHGISFHKKEVSKKHILAKLGGALRSIKNKSEDKISFIVAKEFLPNDPEAMVLKDLDYRAFSIDVQMQLQIRDHWQSFEDYLKDFRTKFRTRTNKVFEKSAGVKLVSFSESEIENNYEVIHKLYDNVLEKVMFKVAELPASAFGVFKKYLGDQFIFNAYFSDNQMVGFSTCFVNGSNLEAFQVGLDYRINSSHKLYERMLLDFVKLAITTRKNTIYFGRTAETIKSSVGAVAQPMHLFVRHRNTISNNLLKPLITTIEPSPFEIRNPFKKTSSL